MISNHKPTMEEHREMGRAIRNVEAALDALLEHSGNFYAQETDRILRFEEKLGCLKARLEDTMFRDHPELGDAEGFAVYYGDE